MGHASRAAGDPMYILLKSIKVLIEQRTDILSILDFFQGICQKTGEYLCTLIIQVKLICIEFIRKDLFPVFQQIEIQEWTLCF